jgi:hypothetical protein
MKLALSQEKESQCTFQGGNTRQMAVAGVLRGSSNESDGFAGAMVRLEVLAGRTIVQATRYKWPVD